PNTEPPVPALVPVADWTRARLLIDGKVLLASEGEALSSARELDMRRGLLRSTVTHRTSGGVTVTGEELRLLSQADRSMGLQLLRLWFDRDDLDVRLEASFSFSGIGMEPERLERDLAAWRTEVTDKGLAMAGAARLTVGGQEVAPERPFSLKWVWRWRSKAGEAVELDR